MSNVRLHSEAARGGTSGMVAVRRVRVGRVLSDALAYILLSVGALVMVVPFLWMISTAVKPEGEVFLFPPQWIPNPILWDNFTEATAKFPFVLASFNSLLVSTLTALGQLISCALAAFAFARYRFPGRNVIFAVLMATIMIPGAVTLIPVFVIMKQLGWVDTLFPLIVPSFTGGAFGTFLLRQFFLTIPGEYDDSARLDGASSARILWSIYLPLSRPALATLAVFSFMGAWNDFITPLIYLSTPEHMTLTVGLSYFQGQYNTQWNLMMAATLISILPILLLYAVAQRYFIQGIASTGLKG
jgi:ABC-type glycerol-3-phosphate transport system permease component